MSKYTTREILDMIDAGGGSERLNLWGKDLAEIDLGYETIEAELRRVGGYGPARQRKPRWLSQVRLISLFEYMYGAGVNLKGATLAEANLQGADLRRADLRDASLEGAILRHADLENADLEGADLRHADLEGANLRIANLERANLGDANLHRVDLRDATSIKGIFLYRTLLDHTHLTRQQLKGGVGEELLQIWSEAKEAYLVLKNNFEQIGRYDDASWAYRKERQMEKLEAWDKTRSAIRLRRYEATVSNGLKAASDQLVEFVCDYGEGIWQVIRSLFLLWLVFAVLYGAIWGVWGPWQEASGGKIRYATRNPLHLLAFGLGAMTTVQPAGLEARPTPAMQILVPLQAVLGIVLAGLLGFVLGNRIRRS